MPDRPDGTLPPVPIKIEGWDGDLVFPPADASSRQYFVPHIPEPSDGRGHNVWYDDCQDSVAKYLATLDGAYSVVVMSNMGAYNGLASMLLEAGEETGDSVELLRGLPSLQSGKVGAELRIAFVGSDVAAGFKLQHYDGAKRYTYGIRYQDHGTPQIQFWGGSGAGSWDTYHSIALRAGQSTWTTIKMVIDLVTHLYHRIILDGVTYLLEALDPSIEANAEPVGTDLTICSETLVESLQRVLVGSVLITDQEPATRYLAWGTPIVPVPIGEG